MPNCPYENQEISPYSILKVLIPDQKDGHLYKMQDLLNFNLNNDWIDIEGSHCENCESIIKSKTSYSNFSQVVVIFLQLGRRDGSKMQNLKIDSNSVTKSSIVLNNERYDFASAVFHHGETFHCGHYTAIYRAGENLIKANDLVVEKLRRWPSHSKDIYMLLYTRKGKPNI